MSSDAAPAELRSHSDAVIAFLRALPASDFRVPGSLVQIPATASVVDALKLLSDANVTGAPVYDDATTSVVTAGLYAHAVPVVSRKYLGFVDVSDLALMVVSKGLTRPSPEGILARVGSLFTTDVEHLVENAINLSGNDPFCGLSLSGNLAQAARVLSKGVHRIAVVDVKHDAHVVGIITSSTVLGLIHENIGVIGSLGDVPVGRLFPTGTDALTTCSSLQTARHAFTTLAANHYLGMPIVNEAGAIVGNISASDIRAVACLSREECDKALDTSVYSFLTSTGHSGKDVSAIRAPVTVYPTDSLSAVIRILVTSRIHRVYIVDAESKPLGLISVTDMLRVLLAPVLDAHSYVTSPTAPLPSPDLYSFLHRVTADEFLARAGVPFEGIVDVSADKSAVDVLRLMEERNVSGVAIYIDEAIPMTGVYGYGGPGFVGAYVPVTEKKYIGWVDAADVSALLLERGLKDHSKSVFASLFSSDSAHSAKAAINFSGRDPFWAVQTSRPLDQVLHVLSHNVHRLAVVDVKDARRFKGVVTQSSMLSFLSEHKALLASLGSVTMASFVDKEAHPVIACSSLASVRDALTLMLGNKITGLPVVEGEGGDILANMSLTDVRRLSVCKTEAQLEGLLAMNVLEYLRRPVEGGTEAVSLTPLVLQLDDSLSLAVELLAGSKTHRVYIVEGRKPVGVVTLGTLLRAIAHKLPKRGHAAAAAAEESK